MQLQINWNVKKIKSELNVAKVFGFQSFQAGISCVFNDKVPVIRGIGGELSTQLMTWCHNSLVNLNTKYARCLILTNKIKVNNRWYSPKSGYFLITATFLKAETGICKYQYMVSMHIRKNANFMPAIIPYAEAIKYLKCKLSAAEILSLANTYKELIIANKHGLKKDENESEKHLEKHAETQNDETQAKENKQILK